MLQPTDAPPRALTDLPLPPLAPGRPLVGNLIEFVTQPPRNFLMEQYRTLGPIFRFSVLNRTLTVLAGVEANQFVNKEGRDFFRTYETWHGLDQEFGAANSLFSTDGPDHARARRVQKSGFSRGTAEAHLPQIDAITRRAAQRWPVGKSVPGVLALQHIITEEIGQIAAHHSPAEYIDDLITFIRTALLVNLTKQRPRLWLYLPAYRRAKQRVWELSQQVRESHRTAPAGDQEPDLIDNLLALAAEDPDFLPEGNLRLSILGPFIAGLDTAAAAMAFLLYCLLTHPPVLEQVTAEVDAFFAQGAPTPERLKELDVLHRATMESLRLYPIAPAIQRNAAQTFEFAGHRVNEGDTVLIATTLPHTMPEYFPDPMRFDIERHAAPRKEYRQTSAFVPFGLGAHTCLGAGMAEVLIMMSTATLLHTVRLGMDPPNYALKIDPFPTPCPDKRFRLKVMEQRNGLA